MVLAESAPTTTIMIARSTNTTTHGCTFGETGIEHRGNRSVWGDGYHRFERVGGESDFVSAHGGSSIVSLCLRSLNDRSRFYLQTLYRRRNLEKERYYHTHEYDETSKSHGNIDFCWESIRDATIQQTISQPGPKRGISIVVSSSSSVKDNSISGVASHPSILRLERNSNKWVKDKAWRQSLAQKMDLLFATKKVQNNEIALPRSIAGELYRRQEQTGHNKNYSARPTSHDDVTTATIQSGGSTPSALPLPKSIIGRSPRADSKIDLTGRWRPSKRISSQDLTDYDEFLKACCSDEFSYWTRKLVTSSSIVSRQEFFVNQSDGGRVFEFIDYHPMTTTVWNRTIVTSSSSSSSSSMVSGNNDKSIYGSSWGGNNAATAKEQETIGFGNSNQPYANRLDDPGGSPVIVEAYWQKNGTVYTSLLRKIANDNDEEEHSATMGWLQTSRYLSPGNGCDENDAGKNLGGKPRVMVVETTYYPALLPPANASVLLLQSKSGSDTETGHYYEDKATRMVWEWEEIDESIP